MKTMSEAREIIARLAEREGHRTFAREVRHGQWDHRSDVIAARNPDFQHRPIEAAPQPRSYDLADDVR